MNIEDAAHKIKHAHFVYIIGNGGSASAADHFANDLVKKCGIKAISLCSNNALVTAFANDCGYENIFVEQLKVFLSKEDVLVALSTSGKSENILKAITLANLLGATVIEFPTGITMLAEDQHIVIIHEITRMILE